MTQEHINMPTRFSILEFKAPKIKCVGKYQRLKK